MVYLDTSVLAAYYCPEALSAKAEKAILRGGRPAISLLVEVEFSSAVGRKLREGALSRADAVRIVSRFNLHIAAGCYERLAMESSHYEIAREWIGQFIAPLRTLDALHLAVCFANDAILLTADAGMAKAAHGFRVKTELLS
ncbi:MAG: type II toxin-antitoxin system VapC family toxin [Lentisphaerae bacterium]|nr:type II toxin-antitoxin system VapC family toxin [Lentisphaerota bacterium]